MTARTCSRPVVPVFRPGSFEICGEAAYWQVSISVGLPGAHRIALVVNSPEAKALRCEIPLTVYFCAACVREIEEDPLGYLAAVDLLEREPHLWRQVRAWFELKKLGEPSRTCITLKFSRQDASTSSTRHPEEAIDGSTQSAH